MSENIYFLIFLLPFFFSVLGGNYEMKNKKISIVPGESRGVQRPRLHANTVNVYDVQQPKDFKLRCGHPL